MRPLIQGQVQLLSLFPSVALHRIETVGFKLGSGAEEMGVVEVMLNMPCMYRTGQALDSSPERSTKDRMALVDAAGDVGVAAGAEDGGGAGIGVDAGEVGRGQGEAAIRVVDGGGVVQEEGAFGFVEMALRSAEDEGAELETASTSGKKGGRFVPRRRFSKSNRPPTRPLVETDLKKGAAVLSAQMPEGVSKPTMPSGLIRFMARSTKSE